MTDATTKRHVMIIDDDQFLLDMYVLKLREAGLEVTPCTSGMEALEQLRSGERMPELILLDVVMPGMDGFSFLEELQSLTLSPRPKLVVLSNQGQERDRARAQELGVDEYIVKASAVPSEVVDRCLAILEK